MNVQYSDYKGADVKPNDVYKWHHPSESTREKRESGTSYWCCSGIAIAQNDRLYDTYWAIIGSNGEYRLGGENDKIIKPDASLTLIGNLNDFDWQGDYVSIDVLTAKYRPEDILNLNHANSSRRNLFLKKGATPCIEIQRNALLQRIEEARRDIESTKRRIENFQRELDALDSEEAA